MAELSLLSRVLTYVFLVSVMLSIGLEVTGRQILGALGNVGLMGRALFANLVLVPILGLVLVSLVPMPPDVAVGILILAAAPGAPFAVNFTSKAKGAVAFAAALLFVFTVVALVVSPPLAGLLLRVDTPLALPAWRVVRSAILYLLLPLVVGFTLQRWAASAAVTLRKPVSLCASLSFPAVTLLTMGMKSAATRAIGAPAIGVVLTLVVGGMFFGWALGGPETATRQVLATGTSMRNAMVALLIARTSFPDSDVDLAVFAFSALMVPPNLILTIYQSRRARALATRRGTPVDMPR